MKPLFTLLCSLTLLCSVKSYAYTERNLLTQRADIETLKTVLVPNRQWVPYPAYSDREGWDKLLGDWKETYIARGEKRLDYRWQVVKATDYLEFERSGNRVVMENPFDGNNSAITDLMMAELAEGKGRFIDQLINGVFHTCEMTSWALSAHLSAQLSHRSLPESEDCVIDLTSGDLGSILSWAYYYFADKFDRVNPEISRRLRAELQHRILDTYMNVDRFWWMGVNFKPGDMLNNWNPWCNFNVLQCFMLLEDDTDKLAAGVYRTMVSVDKFINYTKGDGACEEGPSYWGHAAGKMYDYLQLLSYATGGKVSIFDQPVVRNMGEYISRSYVGDGWVVNFADASARGGGDAQTIYRYGKAVGSEEMMHYAAYLEQIKPSGAPAGRDVTRALQSCLYRSELAATTPSHTTAPYTWYPETEFCYMSDSKGLFVAAKGGYNNESHNHNDAGTFSLYLNNMPMVIDVGVGTYTRQTFSSERYSIWTMQSNYHNLPMINGTPESFGSKYRATNLSFNAKKKSFALDIASAYPADAAVESWIRTYTLKEGRLTVNDNFKLKEAKGANVLHFMLWGNVDIATPGTVVMEVNGQKLQMAYDKNRFEASIETIELDDPRLSNVWGKQIYRLSLTALTTPTKGSYSYTFTVR